MERIDPNALADGRHRTGTDQPDPQDLDGGFRALSPDEEGGVAAVAWAKRNGLTQALREPEPKPEPETDPESGSDWSEDRLQKYFDLRNAEREAANNPHVGQRDPNMPRLTAGSPMDAAAFPDEYK
jgi:hypothetical protein